VVLVLTRIKPLNFCNYDCFNYLLGVQLSINMACKQIITFGKLNKISGDIEDKNMVVINV